MVIRLKAILFDMDGVLVDVSRSYRHAIEETARHFIGREVVPGTVQRYKDAGGFNDDWRLTHTIISDNGVHVSFQRVVDAFQRRYRGGDWDGFIAEEAPLVKSDTLQKISNGSRVLGLVTGRPDAEARWTLAHFGWTTLFPLVVPMEHQDGRGKPDPFPLQRALALLEASGRLVRPEEAVYIGDTGDDMKAARSAGLWVIGIVPPYPDIDITDYNRQLYSHGAHLVLKHMDDLPVVLDDLVKHMAEKDDGSSD